MKHLVLWLLSLLPFCLFSQVEQDQLFADERYLEDQFYIGLTYNFLLNQPTDVDQRNLSYGLQAGFIKDIPLNQNRTLALGLGLGVGLNTYYSNILATETSNGIEYTVLNSDDDFRRSKLETHLIEMPLEFRWRNSTASEHRFWRVYSGIKLSYAFDARSKFISDPLKDSFSNNDVRDFQYGLTFSFGYNTFNIHAYYSLTGLFNDGVLINGQDINMKPLQIGLIFYIL
ncbi:FIG00649979: hypothetical protein [hydrothermal vent metagenome]|uniref:Outer membrane protein beta-barrel domain-containing protein n=1 Tax=hydrothermal vent metagenome TaxID=652676 RepID=A0A3B0SZ74_9ZZZZ